MNGTNKSFLNLNLTLALGHLWSILDIFVQICQTKKVEVDAITQKIVTKSSAINFFDYFHRHMLDKISLGS